VKSDNYQKTGIPNTENPAEVAFLIGDYPQNLPFSVFAQKHPRAVRIALFFNLIYLACGPGVRRNAN